MASKSSSSSRSSSSSNKTTSSPSTSRSSAPSGSYQIGNNLYNSGGGLIGPVSGGSSSGGGGGSSYSAPSVTVTGTRTQNGVTKTTYSDGSYTFTPVGSSGASLTSSSQYNTGSPTGGGATNVGFTPTKPEQAFNADPIQLQQSLLKAQTTGDYSEVEANYGTAAATFLKKMQEQGKSYLDQQDAEAQGNISRFLGDQNSQLAIDLEAGRLAYQAARRNLDNSEAANNTLFSSERPNREKTLLDIANQQLASKTSQTAQQRQQTLREYEKKYGSNILKNYDLGLKTGTLGYNGSNASLNTGIAQGYSALGNVYGSDRSTYNQNALDAAYSTISNAIDSARLQRQKTSGL